MKRTIVILLCAVLLGLAVWAVSVPRKPTAEPETANAASAASFRFRGEALDGTVFDESFFAGHTLTMLNFWAPWCGPCVREMPELEQLANDYAEQGFAILGVCVDWSDAASVQAAVDATGVSYPILDTGEDLRLLMSDYIPTTVFVDSEGKLLFPNGGSEISDAQLIGANSYEGWAQIIEGLLG